MDPLPVFGKHLFDTAEIGVVLTVDKDPRFAVAMDPFKQFINIAFLCHIGGIEIVELFERAIEEYHVEDEVVLSGSFCIGKCNRIGVTVQVNDDIHVGVTRENFREFFKENILDVIENEGK